MDLGVRCNTNRTSSPPPDHEEEQHLNNLLQKSQLQKPSVIFFVQECEQSFHISVKREVIGSTSPESRTAGCELFIVEMWDVKKPPALQG